MKKGKEKERAPQAVVASKFKNIATTSQSPTQGDVIHQSTGQSQAQSFSELHPTVFTPPSAPANPTFAQVTTSVTPVPTTITIHAGCWSLFLLRIGCVSASHASDYH